MTNEEAIKWIKQIQKVGYQDNLLNHKESLEMAIKALEQEPCDKYIKEIDHLRKYICKLETQIVEQEHCEDAISRQAALEVLEDFDEDAEKMKPDAFSRARGRMCNLPSVRVAEKVGQWIPVSERLPEVNQRVLVTSYGRVCYAMMTSADGNSGYPIFRLQDSLNERVICETTVHSEWTTSRITAWMPLPQPYKGESEDAE